MNDMEIPMPTPKEKERAVAEILAACPRRPWLWRELEETFRAVGLKNLFFGTGDCLFLALLVLLLCLFPAARLTVELGAAGPVLFFLSPALYAALVLLTAWKEQQSGTLELLGVARISLRMLAALRMLCFGGASVAVCVPISLTVWQLSNGALSLGWALSLSLSSLFLYGALSLFCQRMGGWPGLLGAPCAWGRCRGGTDALGKDGLLSGGRAGGGLLSGGRRGHRPLSDGAAPLLPAAGGRRYILCSQLNM